MLAAGKCGGKLVIDLHTVILFTPASLVLPQGLPNTGQATDSSCDVEAAVACLRQLFKILGQVNNKVPLF